MQTKLSETTALSGFASPTGKKLLKVASGKYKGRMIALYKTSLSDIKYSFSKSPYDNWSAMQTIVTDCSDDPIDATMNENGDVYLVYCETGTNYLVSVKLTITDSGWSIGSKVYIYSTTITNMPSISIDNSGNLYVSFAMLNVTSFDLHVKVSTDDGLTWGSGSSDSGEQLAVGMMMTIPKTLVSENDLLIVYVTDWNEIKVRSRELNGSTWTTEYVIVSTTNIDYHFDAAVLPGGFFGVVYDDNQLNYREFNGTNWSPIVTIDSHESFFPQISLVDNIPVIMYLTEYSSGSFVMKQSNKLSGTFSTPQVIEKNVSLFDSVLLYSQISETYEDKTSEASSTTTADLFHSASSALLENVGDKLYLGADTKCRFIRLQLSTVGISGQVSYAYYDGSNWKSFTPESGMYHLDSLDKEIILWTDFDSVPSDWQKNIVNGISSFWIKIEVSSSFTTAPIGSECSSISNLNSVSVRR